MRGTPLNRRLLAELPTGRSLPADAWSHRHRGMLLLLALHVPLLAAFAILRGFGVGTVTLTMLPVIALLAAAAAPAGTRTGRAVALVLGLLICSALLVLFWGGMTEAHFHYFVVVGVVALYEAWVPYAIAFAFVVLQHGIGSALLPHAVYHHEHPWLWALVHGAFVATLGIANVVSWSAAEHLRRERGDAEASLAHQAKHDPLTGLANRKHFAERLEALLADGDVAVLFADLDDFKVVNDSLGHAAGDEVLVATAARMTSVLRPGDVLARFGGDEFVIALPGVRDAADAGRVADRVARALAERYSVRGIGRVITASIGIAMVGDVREVDALVRDADLAMYRAKELGKARSVVVDDALREQAMIRMKLEAGLRRALTDGELEVHYQPQVAFSDGRLVGVEALVRWKHPRHGMIAPGSFIPVAEQSGLIDELGAWVLGQACRQLAVWDARRGPDADPLVMSVNVSARQLGDPALAHIVATTLDDSGVDPARICLELTESAIVADPDAGALVLAELKALGVRLAIDDFGVGHSSLGLLSRFADADVLKLDKTFVDDVEQPQHRAIATAVVGLARAFGFTVVAEGVETAVQVDVLRELGCDVAQGFHFARPAPAAAIDVTPERRPAGRAVPVAGG